MGHPGGKLAGQYELRERLRLPGRIRREGKKNSRPPVYQPDRQEAFLMEERTTIVKKTVKTGITFGSALAMVISYTTWQSVGWAIVHGLLSWFYVIYFVLLY